MSIYLTRYAPILFWLLISVITFLLLMEQNPSVVIVPYLDKVIHAMLFAMLTAIGYLAYVKHRLWLYLGLICYGAMTELLQGTYTQTRHASIGDWMADVVGVLLCVILINKLKSLAQRHVR
jgi:VanZ family protein